MQAREDALDEEEASNVMDVSPSMVVQNTEEADNNDNDGDDATGNDVPIFYSGHNDIEDFADTTRARALPVQDSEPVISSGFTAINAPARRISRSSDEDAVVNQVAAKTIRELVPIISHPRLHSEELREFEDHTAGSNIVRRVFRELEADRGELRYEVEFGDLHVEEVCVISNLLFQCIELARWCSFDLPDHMSRLLASLERHMTFNYLIWTAACSCLCIVFQLSVFATLSPSPSLCL